MPFEAEIGPLFIGGILFVSILELVFGISILKNNKSARNKLIGHVISMLVAFAFLIKMFFASSLNVDLSIASISNSTDLGMFGIFWAISVAFIVSCIDECIKK